MYIVLKRDWEVLDGQRNGEKAVIKTGRHEVERVENPFGYKAPWIVLKGTLIGMTEVAWRKWKGPEWGDREVIIEDDL